MSMPASPYSQMTHQERMVGEDLLNHLTRRMSVWHFGRAPILLGVAMLCLGGVLVIAFGRALLAPNAPGTQVSAGTIALSLVMAVLMVGGIGSVGFGVVRLVLGMLAAGRGHANSQLTHALIDAELAAGQVEVSTHRILACCLLSDASFKPRAKGLPAGYLCQTDRGYVALLDEVLAFGFASSQQPLLPKAMGTEVTISVLPRSRRLLRLESKGVPMVPAGAVNADDLPDFSRGYQLMREDHLRDEIVAAFQAAAIAPSQGAPSRGETHAAR